MESKKDLETRLKVLDEKIDAAARDLADKQAAENQWFNNNPTQADGRDEDIIAIQKARKESQTRLENELLAGTIEKQQIKKALERYTVGPEGEVVEKPESSVPTPNDSPDNQQSVTLKASSDMLDEMLKDYNKGYKNEKLEGYKDGCAPPERTENSVKMFFPTEEAQKSFCDAQAAKGRLFNVTDPEGNLKGFSNGTTYNNNKDSPEFIAYAKTLRNKGVGTDDDPKQSTTADGLADTPSSKMKGAMSKKAEQSRHLP